MKMGVYEEQFLNYSLHIKDSEDSLQCRTTA